jgi:hypothetical protein
MFDRTLFLVFSTSVAVASNMPVVSSVHIWTIESRR